jgi:hypothetical protein
MYLENKYTKCYYRIISVAKSRTLTGYVEKHHIIPKSFGGTNEKENIVKLTAREHFICHRLLVKMTEGDLKKKMIHAVWSMTRSSNNQSRLKITGRTYDTIRTEFSKMLSSTRKGVMNKGKKLSTEHKLAISKSTKGRVKTEETKAKMKESWKFRPSRSAEHCEAIRKSALGRKQTEETKRKMSESKKGKTPTHTLVPFVCEHCGKSGVGIGNYNRWHGKNCRLRTV